MRKTYSYDYNVSQYVVFVKSVMAFKPQDVVFLEWAGENLGLMNPSREIIYQSG